MFGSDDLDKMVEYDVVINGGKWFFGEDAENGPDEDGSDDGEDPQD